MKFTRLTEKFKIAFFNFFTAGGTQISPYL